MKVEYIIIGIVFLLALWFIIKKIMAPFSKKGGGCDKGCGCSSDKSKEDSK